MLRLTVSLPACLGIKHPFGAYDQTFVTVWRLQAFWWALVQFTFNMLLNACIYVCNVCMYLYTIYTRPLSVQAQYSRSCPIINCSCYNGSLLTWTVVCLTASKFKPLRFLWITSKLVSVITSRHGPRTKHSSMLYSGCFHGKAFICEGLTSNDCVYLLIKNLLPSSECCFVVYFEAVI
jgi:hypothetical protein